MSTPSASKSGADAPHSLKIMNNDSKNSIPIIPVSDVPSRPLNEDNEIFQNSKDGVNMGPSNRNKKSVAVKKLEKRIIRLTAQAITDFGMIEDGDRVMVAMSGGKDSFVLLDALRTLQKRAPIKFDRSSSETRTGTSRSYPKDVSARPRFCPCPKRCSPSSRRLRRKGERLPRSKKRAGRPRSPSRAALRRE